MAKQVAKQKTAFGLPTVFAVKKSKAVSGSRVFDTRWPSAVTVGFEPEGKQTHDSAFVPETAKTPRTLNYYSGGRDPAGAAIETKSQRVSTGFL